MNKLVNNHITKAHDHLFRMAMLDKRVAREFFEAHLPDDFRKHVNLDHLELQPGTFIDDMRQESIADMLFKTMIDGHDTYLYLVVDHQSRPDELMPFRCLKYICNFIDQHLKSNKTKRLPMVLPMVVYHGKQSWHYSTNINDLVDAPKELIEKYFLKPFQLIDLTLISDEELKKHIWIGVVELSLKHIFARDMLFYLTDIIKMLKLVEQSKGTLLVEIVLMYLLDRGEFSDKEIFVNMVKTGLSPEVGEKIMTIAEQFKAEGMQQGMQQGVQRSAIALRMLFKGEEISIIAKETGLSIEEIEMLKNPIKNH